MTAIRLTSHCVGVVIAALSVRAAIAHVPSSPFDVSGGRGDSRTTSQQGVLSRPVVPNLDDLFALYAAGHESEALDRLVSQRFETEADVRLAIKELDSRINTWPRNEAAAFALEAASGAILVNAVHPSAFQPHFGEILEIGAKTLRKSPPSAFEHQWFLAAVALLTGPASDMRGGATPSSLHPGSARMDALKTLHARSSDRFPRDPELALEWGITREAAVQAWLYSWGTTRHVELDAAIPSEPWSADPRQWLDDAASAFETAKSDPALQGEATLRSGLTDLYRGNEPGALAAWLQVPAFTHDRGLRYLALMFTGRARDHDGSADAAIDAFRSAAAEYPGAQSAVIPLAALLYLSGRQDEAATLVRPIIAAQAPATDPWWTYTDEHLAERMAAIRPAAK